MSSLRYRDVRHWMIRLIVGLSLLIVLILPTYLLIGILTLILPAGLSVGIGMITTLTTITFGTRFLAEKLERR